MLPYTNDLEYLQDELNLLEVECRLTLVRLTQERMAEASEQVEACRDELDREIDEHEREQFPPARLRRRHRNLRAQQKKLARVLQQRLAKSPQFTSALTQLCQLRGLDAFERSVLLLALAPIFSQRFADLYHQIGHRMGSCLTVEVIFDLQGLSLAQRIEHRRYFSAKAPLVLNDLIQVAHASRLETAQELLAADVDMPMQTFDYLTGHRGLADQFLEFSSFQEPCAGFDQVVLDPEDKRRILAVVEKHDRYLAFRRDWGFDEVIRYGKGVLMLFHGAPGTGKTITAHAVAQRLGKKILNVDIPTFIESRESNRFLPGLFREARLHDAVLFFDECEAIFQSRLLGNSLMTLLLTELEQFEGVAILATNLPETLDEALDRRILVKVRFPSPDREARLEIWRKHLPPRAPLAPDVDLDSLADRFDMSGGYIKNAVLTAVADAVHSDGEHPVIRMEHLERAARAQVQRPNHEFASLLQPKARLEDVVLPADLREQIEELIAAARSRRTVLDRWGIGKHLSRGKGVSALFFGEPGTGKTLTAEVVAGELGKPLRITQLPALVSKWVGETEKNLAALFAEARATDAVLFIDEADSLLTSRGEGNASRHDDAAVNTLLQLVEEHEGVVLLASNLATRLDKALARRLTYLLQFPLPDAAARTAIWTRMLPPTVPTDGPLDLVALGRCFAVSGGQIKNAVFKAAFRAARRNEGLSMLALEQAAAEELGGTAKVHGTKAGVGFRAA
jgi:SpoVK/Ycf46/Vps4 family AAA+-type ATPase